MFARHRLKKVTGVEDYAAAIRAYAISRPQGSGVGVALKLKENRMTTYVCSAAGGRLTPVQKAQIVRSITAIHHEETGAPSYLVQVIFYDLAPDSHYVAGQLAPADQIWVRGDIRGGRTNEQKNQMLHG